MNRTEFIVVTASILMVAFAFGWFANWLVHRFRRVGQTEMSELDRMAQQLHEAEEMRDQAIEYYQARETQFTAQLTQTEAELRATMDGLRESRQETEELRSWIERQNLG